MRLWSWIDNIVCGGCDGVMQGLVQVDVCFQLGYIINETFVKF